MVFGSGLARAASSAYELAETEADRRAVLQIVEWIVIGMFSLLMAIVIIGSIQYLI